MFSWDSSIGLMKTGVMGLSTPRGRKWAFLAVIWLSATLYLLYPSVVELTPKSIHVDASWILPTLMSGAERVPQDIFKIPPVEEDSIKVVCRQTEWNENLVFTCFQSVGGIGNIRNSILLCVRYAIQAGASLVLPRIVVRDEGDIEIIRTGRTTEFTYMFDTEHFVQSMRLSCPQMQIHMTLQDVLGSSDPDQGEEERVEFSLHPEDLVKGDITHAGIPHPETWRRDFYNWLQQKLPTSDPGDLNGTIIVNLQRSYMSYPIYSDGEAFALSFASILQFNSVTRVLATKTLRAMAERFFPGVDLRQEPLPNAFFGAHMRTEKDALVYWGAWTYGSYENQAKAFLGQAPRSNPKAIYVASGQLEDVARFAQEAAAQVGLSVVTKFDLLHEGDLMELDALTFDQQALIDYMVLLRASDFGGVAHSSFSWSIGLRRHVLAKIQTGYLDFTSHEMLNDDLSRIYGDSTAYEHSPDTLWPKA